MAEYTVGQKLWYVPSSKRSMSREVTIQKVGKKWLTMDFCGRLDKADLVADGGEYASPGRAYLSREEYEKATEIYGAWQEIRAKIRDIYAPPAGVTVEKIAQAKIILFGE